MKILIRILTYTTIVFLICPILLFSQSFDKSVLIDIPGQNYDFDLFAEEPYPYSSSFITWINKNDTVFTVYLKRISPEISDTNIVISSDNIIKSSPKLAFNARGINVAWENRNENYFQVAIRCFSNDSLGSSEIILDSLIDDPQISLSALRLAFILENKLFVKELYPDTSEPLLIDSLNCSSPNIFKGDYGSPQILYERIVNENHQIYLAYYENYPEPKWTKVIMADGNNSNPVFGIGGGGSFETIENGITRIKYTESIYPDINFFTTENTDCNYKNPDVFSYPIPTDPFDEDTPFFVAFDTDSLENNNEVFIKTFFASDDSLINISDMEGEDSNPKIAYIFNNGINYVVIVWQHKDNSNTSIWMAKTIFHPAGSVKDDIININSFDLLQNYPNPFNPVTNIGYFLENGADIKIRVFDILGNHIRTLSDEYKSAGSYKIQFDGADLPSGVYFYSMEVNGLQKTKSMVLLK